ncbi:MAG: GNAT family N-acetyltransferase [Clostridia bacterium]|nr:GNAT family N-acetyltransferase [Clostridia bacterium]
MEIRYAKSKDIGFISEYDDDISEEVLKNAINLKRLILAFEDGRFIGWLRYNLFWDNIPFMNLLYILDGERGKGYGSQLVSFWEKEMSDKGFDFVLTSTQSNEEGQFFYRKLGYTDRGSLLLPKEPLEIIFYKKIKKRSAK